MSKTERWMLEIKSSAGAEEARLQGVAQAEREGYTVKKSNVELLGYFGPDHDAATYRVRLSVLEE